MNDVTETQNESAPISLADIAGMSIDNIAEVRFEELPAMRAAFALTAFDFQTIGDKEIPVCKLGLKVMQVEAFNDDGDDSDERKEKMVGKSHNETIFIDPKDVATGLGRVKAYLADCGFAWEEGVSIGDIGKQAAASNIPFIADVKKRKKKDTENEFYTNVYPVNSINTADATEEA